MKCPKCKKSTSLQTKRTIVCGNRVDRDRQCPRCKTRFTTVEQFQSDIDASQTKAIEQIASMETERDNFRNQLENYWELFRGLARVIKEAGK